jgi:hypothetical protein
VPDGTTTITLDQAVHFVWQRAPIGHGRDWPVTIFNRPGSSEKPGRFFCFATF